VGSINAVPFEETYQRCLWKYQKKFWLLTFITNIW